MLPLRWFYCVNKIGAPLHALGTCVTAIFIAFVAHLDQLVKGTPLLLLKEPITNIKTSFRSSRVIVRIFITLMHLLQFVAA